MTARSVTTRYVTEISDTEIGDTEIRDGVYIPGLAAGDSFLGDIRKAVGL